MNIKSHFCLSRQFFPAIALYSTQQNWKFLHIVVIANIQSFTSQIFGVVGPLGENIDFLAFWDLTFKQILITKPPKSSSTRSELKKLSE